MEEDPNVAVFREYLRIRTDHPNPDYGAAVEFLKKQAERIGLPHEVHRNNDRPVVVLSWIGQNPSLPSILLNSHMDVVPTYTDKWSHDPFAAHKTEDGKIYGRGAQDMKSQGIQYLGAVARLKREGFKPNRTIHISFVPDEEIGGQEGMGSFVHSVAFQALNVGFAIDESCAVPEDFCLLFFTERGGWGLEVICSGPTGHGSLLMKNTASEKANVVIREFYDRRKEEEQKLVGFEHPELHLGYVTTINLTMVEGGVQRNVIPDRIKLTFDIRLSIKEDQDAFAKWIESVAKKAGDGATVNFNGRRDVIPVSQTDDSNPFWVAFKSAVDEKGVKVLPIPCPGNTDGRFLRMVGIPVFGFSPMKNTPTLPHNHDEFVSESVFLEGIDIFVNVVRAISSVT